MKLLRKQPSFVKPVKPCVTLMNHLRGVNQRTKFESLAHESFTELNIFVIVGTVLLYVVLGFVLQDLADMVDATINERVTLAAVLLPLALGNCWLVMCKNIGDSKNTNINKTMLMTIMGGWVVLIYILILLGINYALSTCISFWVFHLVVIPKNFYRSVGGIN